MPEATQDRLRGLGIEVMVEAKGYVMLARRNCVALVERGEAGFGSIGSTGMMTEAGLAFLVWHGGRAYLAAKGNEVEADAEQVEAIQAFSADLKSALA